MIVSIKELKPHIPYNFLFKYFGVSSSKFYDWKRRSGSIDFTKRSDIESQIKDIFKELEE